MKHVDLYFDFVSPYPWLASHQLSELRESTAVKLRFVPVLYSNMGPAEIPCQATLYLSGYLTLGDPLRIEL